MPELPTGIVTFVFTDIEGSTAMLQRLGRDGFLTVLEDHNRLIRDAFSGGVEVRTEGDSFFYAFPSAVGAVACALAAQEAIARHAWPDGGLVKVRMGMHTGEGALGGGDYVGLDVHRAARVAAAGHGGQILLTEATRQAAGSATVLDLGEHAFKDVDAPERVFQATGEGPQVDFPPIRSLTVRANNLPAHTSEFIGRAREVAEVAELLGSHRLVTLMGSGGTGKTRLAVEVASQVLARFADGVTYVPLESLRYAELVLPAIAAALDLSPGEAEPGTAVAEALAGANTLLVLDNFEHVADAAGAVAQLMAVTPDVRLMVTSQSLLHIRGEQAYPLAPLAADDGVALFLARARAADPAFDPTNEELDHVRDIVGHLEAMPLATELAAARIRLFGLSGLLQRVADHFDFSDNSTDRPDRHRTTHAAIAWTYDLLDEDGRRALRRLSVFDGGFTIDAAEAVAGGEALEGVASLLDMSLLTSSVLQGQARFSMLESICRFAFEQLEEADESAEAALGHARYFAALGERVRPLLEQSGQQVWMDRMEAEHDNFRGVYRRAVQVQDPDLALRAIGSAWRYFHRRGHIREAVDWLQRLLDMPGATTEARAAGVDGLAALTYWQGDMATSMELYNESLGLFEELGDGERVGDALFALSSVSNFTGDFGGGRDYGLRARSAYERAGVKAGVRKVAATEAFRMWQSGNLEEALAAWEESRDMFAEAGDVSEQLQTELGISGMRFQMGDHDAAYRGARSAMERMWEINDVPGSIAFVAYTASILSGPNPHGALRLGAAATALRTDAGGALHPQDYGFQTAEELVAGTLSEAEFDASIAAGRAMSLEEAVTTSLTLLDHVIAELPEAAPSP